MSRIIVTLGASAIAFGVMTAGAEAKTISYEINGQRYSYDTTNRQQVTIARKRIEAAKAADEAKAKAEAERTSNPLAALFGSEAQREAAQAQARLQQVLAEQEQAEAATKRERTQRSLDGKPEADATAKAEDPARANEPEQTAALPQDPKASLSSPIIEKPGEQIQSKAPDAKVPDAPVKSITLDAETGIKTVIRADGSISEEPFDHRILSQLVHSPTKGTTDAVDHPAEPSRGEATGSTTIKKARLGSNSAAPLRREPVPN